VLQTLRAFGAAIMFTQRSRHLLLQKLFWSPLGAAVVYRMKAYSRKFDVVVRNYSLIGDTNGERWLLGLMDEAPVVFDVGFHDGASTREILRARPKARVFGFDPSRDALRRHRQDFAADSRIVFVDRGLARIPGELPFYDYENMCNSFAPRKETGLAPPASYEAQITTLDLFCGENGIDHVNFLKIDAEGYDLDVLEGAKDILSRQGVDIFMFEFASGWSATKRYLWEAHDYFEPLPYRLFHLFNGFLCPLVYDTWIDSCCTLPAMYVGVSERRLARGDIPMRDYAF
jgi:FkbM family methyltransferase